MAAPTFKSALNNRLQWPWLTEADREHLKRWAEHERDPVWERIAADARRGELPPIVDAPYSLFIGEALRARQFAQSKTDPPAVQRKRKQQREQQERSDLLALANKMEDVVGHYQACRKAHHQQPVPSPSGVPLPPLLRLEMKQLEWLERNALRVRQLAERVSAGEPNGDWDRIPIHVSRQSGGKRKR